jgi:predicted RNA binding protein YcfA (HicA-like mRNA interferase family)
LLSLDRLMSKIVPIAYKKLCKVFESEGFKLLRQKGDHLVYIKKGILRPVVIPRHENIPVFIIKNNLRDGRISRERYLELLEKI